MQLVAPSAVRIALAIDTIICVINLAVSFFVINHTSFPSLSFNPLCHLDFPFVISSVVERSHLLRINHWRNVGTVALGA